MIEERLIVIIKAKIARGEKLSEFDLASMRKVQISNRKPEAKK